MLSHRALISHLDQIDRLGFLDSDSVLLAAFTFCHVFGLNAVLGSWLRSGARMVIMDGFTGLLRRGRGTRGSPTCRWLRR